MQQISEHERRVDISELAMGMLYSFLIGVLLGYLLCANIDSIAPKGLKDCLKQQVEG